MSQDLMRLQDLTVNQEVMKSASKMADYTGYMDGVTAADMCQFDHYISINRRRMIWIDTARTKAFAFKGSFQKQHTSTNEALPAGRCPPLVSTFSFGGDDMAALMWSLVPEGPGASNKLKTRLYSASNWALHFSLDHSRSSTWLFPEYCLGTMRDDVYWERNEARWRQSYSFSVAITNALLLPT